MSLQLSQPVNVLIIEDNPTDVLLVQLAMKKEGLNFQTQVAVDGEIAIRQLCGEDTAQKQPAPDLIILDLNLPKRHGTEVLQAIRGPNCHIKAPVVILSSSPEDVIEQIVQAANLEADYYLTKPPSLDEFLALGKIIRGCLEAGRQR
jgi:DNA-binding response OmpR family regulator